MLLLLTLQTLTLLSLFPLIHSFLTSPPSIPPSTDLLLPSDAVALLSFKSQADLDHKLLYVLNERFDYCQWEGVKCAQGRVVRFVLQGFGLRGVFSPNTLTRLDQLRVLSLRNSSLSGPVPDLSSLSNLKTLILNRNNFSGSFPPSVFALHRLRVLDFSFNNFTGPIPVEITQLDRLNSLRLEFNRFDGTLPPLNQSVLLIFNVSGNNLMGPIPLTPSLSRFGASSFLWNFGLCGEIVNIACSSHAPFFDSSNASSPQSHPLTQSAQSQGVVLTSKHKKTGLVPGVSIAVSVIVAAVLCLFALARKRHSQRPTKQKMASTETVDRYPNTTTTATASMTTITNQISEMPSKLKIDEEIKQRVHGSGNLVFCVGETQLYTLDQLMRASAELLGRGTMGITYKAVLDNQLIVTVKRLDAGRTAITSSQAFERYMDTVGGLRHPNLVPVRAYFQAKGERLIIYDYQPNGSLFNLIHGSRSTRAKPLHWTSCLKIAEDVAQGLAYIHQASRLIHGNLKSTNVLLGSDFEACLTDYSLAMFADLSANDDPDCSGYKAPETRKSSLRATVKSDVYAYGVLLLELLTGKHPSQHPFLVPTDVTEWVRAMREDDVGEDSQLRMLAEVASICSLTSPEQRPAMWQVLKIINEIKESAMTEENLKL